MSKTYRIKSKYVSLIQKAHIDFIVETRLPIDEADIVNAIIDKYIKEISAKDVIAWKEKSEDEK